MDLSRRRLLFGLAGGTGLLGGARAVDNVLLGYDRFTGTNLTRQDLDPLVRADLGVHDGPIGVVDGRHLAVRDGAIAVSSAGTVRATLVPGEADRAEAAAVADDLGLPTGTLAGPLADLEAIDRGDVRFEYAAYPAFFDRVASGSSRPLTVGALRGPRRVEPTALDPVVGVDPADTPRLVEALAAGLREHTHYDLRRYLAGSVEDNVILGAADLRGPFESPTDFPALAEGEDTGLFCYELVHRSIEAFHAVDAPDQSVPVLAGYVRNERHKHAFTVLASVLRDADGLVVPVTFVDYTRSTLYDDLHLRGVLGEGLDAYTDRQRATHVYWDR